MINMPKSKPFKNKITKHIRAETLHYAAHPAQITKPFLADIRHKPDILLEHNLSFTKRPEDPKQCRNADGIIPNTRGIDALRFFLNLQVDTRREHRIQMSRYDQLFGFFLFPRQPRKDVAQ